MSKPNSALPRVGSSVKISSRLGTPAPDLATSIREKRVANLPISKNLDKLEETLNSLLFSISKYNPNISDAESLVKIEQSLATSVQNIIAHQQAGLDIDTLEQNSTKLDNDCKQFLLGLSECRQSLRSLQTLDNVLLEKKQMEQNKVPADELLQYAMKLAKFTTAPPTFDSNSIGPKNFIWPAEDTLRRGVLAIASLNADKLTNGLIKELDPSSETKENEQESTVNQTNGGIPRRGSFGGSYGDDAQQGGDNDIIEDLDLFDPDDL